MKTSAVTAGAVRNNVSINDALNGAFVDYVNLAGPPPVTQSNNVRQNGTAAGTGSQTGKAAYATYFRNTTAGTEDFHLRNPSLTLWTSNGANLSEDLNQPVTNDVDGAARVRPDIGADEFDVPTKTTARSGRQRTTTPGTHHRS